MLAAAAGRRHSRISDILAPLQPAFVLVVTVFENRTLTGDIRRWMFDARCRSLRQIHLGFIRLLQMSVSFWHVNCSHTFMARKLNTSKPATPHNGEEPETLNRRSQPTAATLYLMQLRSQALKIAPPNQVRLEISSEIAIEEPEPVKIVWIDDDER
jgi:hypothetical protein